MHKLLITGGAGFIGAHFTKYWRKQYPFDTIVVLDKLTHTGNLKNLQDLGTFTRFYFVKGDIGDYDLVQEVMQQYQIDTIVNFAAETMVDRSIDDPDIFIKTNIDSTHNLLKAAKDFWRQHKKLKNKHHFHHISTDEVYGSLTEDMPPHTEYSAYKPNSPYAASKAAADHLIRTFCVTYGMRTTISNSSNNYGAHDYPAKFIPRIITNILIGNKIPIYGDGKQIRNWLFVDDHCVGIEKIIKHGRIGEYYNIANTHSKITNLELTKKICKIIDDCFHKDTSLRKCFPNSYPAYDIPSRFLIKHVQDRPGHDRRYALSADKIQQELDFACHTNLDIGLRKTITWYLKNYHWWLPLIPKPEQKLEKIPDFDNTLPYYTFG